MIIACPLILLVSVCLLQAGFDALYFGRIDYQDREKRIAEKDMEMLWRGSRSLEEEAQIFTGKLFSSSSVWHMMRTNMRNNRRSNSSNTDVD